MHLQQQLVSIVSVVPLVIGLALLRRWGLDKPCYKRQVPNAHPPTYSAGNRPLGDWAVKVYYDSIHDDLIVTWEASATPWRKSARGTKTYAGEQVEEALAEAEYQGRRLGVRRLF